MIIGLSVFCSVHFYLLSVYNSHTTTKLHQYAFLRRTKISRHMTHWDPQQSSLQVKAQIIRNLSQSALHTHTQH